MHAHAPDAAGLSLDAASAAPPPLPDAPPGDPCPPGAPTRAFDVAAINVRITVNRFGENLDGMMYALREDLPALRAEEALRMPTQGLQGDLIQPLTLRAHVGDCVVFDFTNLLDNGERASLHVHGVGTDLDGQGGAVGLNPDSTVAPGESIRFRVFVDPSRSGEGARYFHSHGDIRAQVHFGLFGALIAELPGTSWLDPRTGQPSRSGWDAVIVDPAGPDFREWAAYYHEWGDETFRIRDKEGNELPLVDGISDAYRPGGRAMNYRTESFWTRATFLAEELGHDEDSIQLGSFFSSVTHGDGAQPLAGAYLGDPTKWRIIHGGSEVAHVHHQHGGGIRWPFQPKTSPTLFGKGLQKEPEALPENKSILLDSQTLLPGEAYNVENECGAGGCQQAPGDFLIHCHVNEHYEAGMWMAQRTHNTLQPTLVELPDRAGRMRAPVDSLDLLGTQLPNGTLLTADTVRPWVESLLPSRGAPRDGQDASVMDWTLEERSAGPLYLGPPQTTAVHPNVVPESPGERDPILFDPVTKRLSFPVLRPQIGARPPFAPGHGPTAFLHDRDDGNFDADRLCPAERPIKQFDIRLANMDIPITRDGTILQHGVTHQLAANEEEVRRGERPLEPLILRLNVGDCLRLTFVNGVDAEGENGRFRGNIHPHFGQFDVSASDGAVGGFNYEMIARPFEEVGTRLAGAAAAGATAVAVEDAGRFHEGAWLAFNVDGERFETHRIARIDGNVVHLATPLEEDQSAGSAVTDEFVHYQLYMEIQAGTIYFHSHVSVEALDHGQFGAYVVEPPNSTYRNPRTGEVVPGFVEHECHHSREHPCSLTGTVADILTNETVAAGVPGESFREQMLVIGDTNPATEVWVNYRLEPLDDRLSANGDPSLLLSSHVHGDPFTALLRAYAGDLMVYRVLVGATNEIHSFVMPDNLFRVERFDPDSLTTEEYLVGQSERFDLVGRAGGVGGTAGDFLWYNGMNRRFLDGIWGLLRVHDTLQADLPPLPGRTPPTGVGWPESAGHAGERPSEPPDPGSPCPPAAPRRQANVSLVETDLVFNERQGIARSNQQIFVLDEQLDRVARSGGHDLEPLVLHVPIGSCLDVRFTNRLPDSGERASFHTHLFAKDVRRSSGITAGFNHDQSVAPGESRTYRYFVRDVREGTDVSIVADFGSPVESWALGAFGVIHPVSPNATVLDPRTGLPTDHGADVAIVEGGVGRRVFVIVLQEEDDRIGMDVMPYPPFADGIAAVNYRTEPLLDRAQEVGGPAYAFSSFVHGDPATPVFRAYAGDPVTMHVVMVRGEQSHAFHVAGHEWPFNPVSENQTLLNTRLLAPVGHLPILLAGGAGGPQRLAGDYLFGDQRIPYMEIGMWGILRVFDENATQPDLVRLPRAPPAAPPGGADPDDDRPPPPPGRGPGEVVARPGIPIRFQMELWNLLDATQANLQLRVEAPPQWHVSIFPDPIPPLAPGERVNLTVELTPPLRATGSATVRFLVVFDDGSVRDMGVAPVVHLSASAMEPPASAPDRVVPLDAPADAGGFLRGIPGAAVPLAALAVALAAWARRRRA